MAVATKQLTVLFGGLGNYGIRHLKRCQENESIHVAAVADPKGKPTNNYVDADLDSLEYRPSFNEALAEFRPDLVVNVTPPWIYYEIGKAALEAGVPVYSEKPVTNKLVIINVFNTFYVVIWQEKLQDTLKQQ